jgi:hypothetical protein
MWERACLANADYQSTLSLKDKSHSRAGSLPHWFFGVEKAQPAIVNRLRPSRFATYSALSARRNKLSADSPGSRVEHPRLTVSSTALPSA